MDRRHSTIQRSPETILENWYRPVKLKTRKIRELPPPPEGSREFAIKFLEWLRARKSYSPNSLHRYLIGLRKIVSWLAIHGKSIEEMTYDDYIKMHSDLSEQKLPENVKLVLRYLYELTDDERYLKLYSKIRVKEKKARMVDVLNEEEVQRLIEACSKIDFELKVLVETIYETGARVGEILSLRRKDVEFDEYGARVYIRTSKSEYRCVRVILYATDLSRLCEGKDPEDYIFSYEYKWYLKKLTKAWELAGLPQTKRKFHILRHSRATELLRKRIFTEQEMMKWFGWKTREMIDVYSHITMEDVEERYLSSLLPQLNNNLNNKGFNTKLCPRCGFPIGKNDYNYCPRCGHPLSIEASFEALKKAEKRDKEIEEVKKLLDKLLQIASEKPDLVRHLLSQEVQQL